MTVNTQTVREILPANGVAVEFPFTFPILDPADVVVTLYDPDGAATLQVQNTDYTITEAGVGGAVVFGEAPLDEWEVRIERVMSVVQPTDFRNQGRFFPDAHERAFDRIAMLVQQARQSAGDAMNIVDGDPDSVAGRWDALLRRITNLAAGTDPGDAVNLEQFQEALDAIGHSVWAAFHDSTGTVTVPPATPSGAAPWDDVAQTWDQFPSADTVWISFSLGRSPGANGWWAPIRIVGQDYRPNIYSDPSFAGPHSVTLPPGTDPEDLVAALNGFISPGSLTAEIANAGGATSAIAFTATAGVASDYTWSWAAGGAGITITSPAAASTTLSVPAGEATYFGTLRCVATDGVDSVTREIQVLIQVLAATPSVPATLSAVAAPTDLDENYVDATAAYTAFVQINPTGGRLPLSYAWTKVSGSPNLTLSDIDPSTSPSMRFRSVNPDPENGGALSAVFRCTVRDSAQLDGYPQQSYQVDVPVAVAFAASIDPDPEPPLVVAVNPAELIANLSAPSDEVGGTIQTQLLVGSVLNATEPVTWAWTWESGGTGITIVDAAEKDTRLQVATDNSTLSGVLKLTATDADTRTGEVLVDVTINTAASAPALNAVMSPASLSRSVAAGLIEAWFGRASVQAVDGTTPYTYAWDGGVLLSGAGVQIGRSTAAGLPYADFFAVRTGSASSTVTATYRFSCTVTDASFKSITVHVDVTVTFLGTAGSEGPIFIPE
jgi:hypothetical protein